MQPQKNKKSILVLTPRFPYPVVGGDRLRIYYICKELSLTYNIELLSFCETIEEMNYDVPDDGVFRSIERIFLPRWKSYFNCMFSLFTRKPLQVAYYSSRDFSNAFERIVTKCDAVLAHLVRTAAYVENCDKPKILEMTDAISMNYERVRTLAGTKGFKNIVYAIEQERLNRFEKNIASKFDLSVLVSKVDKDYLFPVANSASSKVIVCSNGVNFDDFPQNYDPVDKTIVFIGNMTTVQNLDAASWFAEHVMPLLHEIDNFRFKVIGRINSQDANYLSSFPGVEVTGLVDSIANEASGALVGVCPMRLGAGVQNKVLEYMALGMPAITSRVGIEGIDAEVGVDILVADEPGAYVKHISELSKDKERAKSIGSNGSSYVRRTHSWNGKLSKFLARVDRLLNN